VVHCHAADATVGRVLIVTGSVTARPDTIDELIRISLEHVHRSRQEPGCLLHSLRAHFAVPGSNDFVRSARELAAGATAISIFEAVAAAV
jgi:quinol monooxygenase YgiN